MSIRRIVVPLTGAEGDSAALRTAFQVAVAHAAHVEGIYMRPDPAEAVPYVGDAASAAVIEDIYRATKTAADAASASARTALETAARDAGLPVVEAVSPARLPSASFNDEMGAVGRVILRQARLADLVVAAELNKNPASLTAFESVLMSARRPVLLAPPAPSAAPGGKIVIAWNGSTEAAYAVTCALPLLKAATSITVLSGDVDVMEGPSSGAVVSYLALRGIAASAAALEVKGRSVGAALIERSAALGADLIVMGGYGHSRLREFILGGVTRHMIANATTAVLMAH